MKMREIKFFIGIAIKQIIRKLLISNHNKITYQRDVIFEKELLKVKHIFF